MKWTASTSSNTYYPLQSTSTATTSTANTLNSVSFYQYYNTAGGYRRFILGNATAYTSSSGAYGTIRLYGTGATYYGDLNPGTIGTNSLTANRTWALPDKTGTIALTSDIPDVSGFITTDSDEKLKIAAVTSGTTYYPIVATNSTTAANRQYDSTGIAYTGTNGTANGSNGNALLALGNSTASTTANWKKGTVRLYGTTAYYTDLVSGAPSVNRTITFPDKTGTVALTDDIPTVPTNVSAFTNDAGYITDSDIPEGASAYTGTPSAVSTTASTGTSNAFARGDHVHDITSSTITSALGYTPYNSTNPNGYITASHTSTYSLPLAASGTRGGVQIGYSESGTNYAVKLSSEKMYVTVPWTDTKVTTAALTSGTTYYPILATGTGTATRQIDSTLGGLKYISTAGSTSAVGTAILHLGNSTASGSSNNEQGVLRMYTINTRYVDIKTESTFTPTGSRIIYLPSYDATMYLTCTNTTDAVGGATTAPVYVDNTGRIQAVTSIPYTLLSGTPTIPTVPSSTGSSTTGITASTTATKTTLGTAGSVTGVQSSTTTASKVTVSGSDSFSATVTSHVLSFSHSAKTVSASDVTVPIKNTSSTSIPNVSVESATVSITDPGHTHTI